MHLLLENIFLKEDGKLIIPKIMILFVFLCTLSTFVKTSFAADYTQAEVQAMLNVIKNGDGNEKAQAGIYFIEHPAIPEAYDTLLSALNDEPSVFIRCNLATAIGEYRDIGAIPALKRFIDDAVKTGSSILTGNAYNAIATTGGAEAEAIIDSGTKSDNILVKNAAVQAIASAFHDLARILPYLSDKEKSTRIVAIESIVYICTPAEAFDHLQPLLVQKDDIEQYDTLLSAMSMIDDDRAIDALVAAMSDDNPAIRLSAISHLPEMKNDKILAALIKALKDTSVGVRAGAAKALGTEAFVEKTAFQPLMDTLDDEAGVVSANVALSLGAYKDKAAMEPLTRALRNDYYRTRSNAALSLFAIGGDEVMDIIGKSMAREVDRKVLSSLIYVMKKMKTDKVAAAKYIDMAIKNSKDDNDKLFHEGHSAQIQLGGMPKAPTPAVP